MMKIDSSPTALHAPVSARRLSRCSARWLAGLLLAAGAAAQAAPDALIGILQGPAVLVRQSTRYTLAEGAQLTQGDIVEVGKGGFAQIEFEDGVILGLGEASRILLQPTLTALKTAAPPRLYLLDGWAKLRLPADKPAAYGVLAPGFELDGKGGTAVIRVQPRAWAVFAEAGAMRLLQRDGGKATLPLSRGDFASLREGSDKPGVTPRIAPDFLEQLPRGFRDPLPPRAALYAKKQVTLNALGPVSYDDVNAWLHTESGVRLALSKQWRGRASDKAFHAAAAANLKAHMEWERVLFPERFLPKKPPVPASAPLPTGALAPASAPAAPPPN